MGDGGYNYDAGTGPRGIVAMLAFAVLAASCAGADEAARRPAGLVDQGPLHPRGPRSCDDAHPPILLQRDQGGLPIRIFAPVEYAGRAELLLFDTGAARTHLAHGLAGQEVIKSAGHLLLGCTSLVVDSWRRRRVPGIDGHPYAVGTLGTDAILATATELDLEAGRWIRYDDGAIPPDAEAWPLVPLEIVRGIPLARVVVDERPLRLMVATGTSDTLLLDERVAGAPNASVTTDAFGNRVELVRDVAVLRWPGMQPERVPVWRTRSHPAFERHVVELGGGIDGILGLSAFGSRRVLIDPKRQTMRLSPPPSHAAGLE